MHVYLFKQDSYFKGHSADASAQIREYANMLDNDDL